MGKQRKKLSVKGDISPRVRSGKFIGYCPDCNLPIVSYEVQGDGAAAVYTCICGSKKKVAKLLEERILEEKYIPEVEDIVIEEPEEPAVEEESFTE